MLRFTFILLVVLVLSGSARVADAQQVIYYVTYPEAAGSLHYHRYYQGSQWYWTPGWGWYRYDRYVDVPHWTTTTYYVQPYSIATW
jgi:hypothetical protein